MANHALPTTGSTYTNFVSELSARMNDIAMGLNPSHTTVTNQPTNTIRYNGSSTKWEKWSGTAWADLAATYAISITGNAGTVTNGVVTTGSYANPSWITSLAGTKISGNIAGNAATATTLATARTINGVSFNGSADINVNVNNAVTFNNAGSGAASGTTFNGSAVRTISYNTIGAPSTTGANASGTWNISITGNASTATTAVAANNATTVTNGVYLTGPQTIAGNKTFADSVLCQDNNHLIALTSGNAIHQVDVTDYWNFNRATNLLSWIVGDVTQASFASNGDFTASGNVTAFSDIRLKRDLHVIPHALDKVSRLTGYTYTRVDTGERQTGLVAQDVQRVLPEAVLEGEYLSLAYGNLAGLLVEAIKELRAEVNTIKGGANAAT